MKIQRSVFDICQHVTFGFLRILLTQARPLWLCSYPFSVSRIFPAVPPRLHTKLHMSSFSRGSNQNVRFGSIARMDRASHWPSFLCCRLVSEPPYTYRKILLQSNERTNWLCCIAFHSLWSILNKTQINALLKSCSLPIKGRHTRTQFVRSMKRFLLLQGRQGAFVWKWLKTYIDFTRLACLRTFSFSAPDMLFPTWNKVHKKGVVPQPNRCSMLAGQEGLVKHKDYSTF